MDEKCLELYEFSNGKRIIIWPREVVSSGARVMTKKKREQEEDNQRGDSFKRGFFGRVISYILTGKYSGEKRSNDYREIRTEGIRASGDYQRRVLGLE